MRYVARDFGDASFVFDLSTGNSIFLEGTLASPALRCLDDNRANLPISFLSRFDLEDHKQIIQDWPTIQLAMWAFLNGSSSGYESIQVSPLRKTALEELSEYAVHNWQLINVNLELTARCNQRCRWCYLDSFQSKGMSRNSLVQLADELRTKNALFVLFTGGELFLRPDTMAIMADFAEREFILEVKTNGTLLTDEIVGGLSMLPLLDVQISIYETHDGWSNLTRAIYPLNRIEDYVRKLVNADVPVTLSVLVGRHNIDRLREIHEHFLGFGAKVFYSPYITPNRSGPGKEISFRLSRREMEEKFGPFLEEINALPAQKRYRDCARNYTVCYAGRDQIAIGPDGTVYPCLDLRLPLGSLKQEPFHQILARRKEILGQFSLHEMAKCSICSLRDYCDSCIGLALVEHGDYRRPSQHKCDIVHFYARERR